MSLNRPSTGSITTKRVRTFCVPLKVGLALKRQKDRLPHGMFGPWIEAEFGMSDQTARNFMNVAKVYADKSQTVGDLAPRALYELAAPSTPPEVRDQVEALVIDGQKVTAADVKRLKAAAKAAQDNVTALSGRNLELSVASQAAKKPAVAVKPICDSLGIEWRKQQERVRRDPILAEGITMVVMPSPGASADRPQITPSAGIPAP